MYVYWILGTYRLKKSINMEANGRKVDVGTSYVKKGIWGN